jgi:phosphoesterase RecJ-like protein
MNFDVLFLIDCNTIERTGFSAPGGSKNLTAKATVVIDHHLTTREDKRHISWIDPKVSATGELIYRLLSVLHVSIDKKIATNLYTAILTDTGGFRYSNTSVESLRIASKLIEAGANTWEITKEVYENIPLKCLRLLTLTLSTLEKKGKIAWITVTQHMFKKTNTSAQDTENFADYPRTIKGVEVGVFFREEGKNLYKASLRSKGMVNVADIAKTFGGGGHANAAGCKLNGSLPEIKKKILKAVRKAIKR